MGRRQRGERQGARPSHDAVTEKERRTAPAGGARGRIEEAPPASAPSRPLLPSTASSLGAAILRAPPHRSSTPCLLLLLPRTGAKSNRIESRDLCLLLPPGRPSGTGVGTGSPSPSNRARPPHDTVTEKERRTGPAGGARGRIEEAPPTSAPSRPCFPAPPLPSGRPSPRAPPRRSSAPRLLLLLPRTGSKSNRIESNRGTSACFFRRDGRWARA
jgi:hypothetical protein